MNRENKYRVVISFLLLLLIGLVFVLIKTGFDKTNTVAFNQLLVRLDSLQQVVANVTASDAQIINEKTLKIISLEKELVKANYKQHQKPVGFKNSIDDKKLKEKVFYLNQQVAFLKQIKSNNEKKLKENENQIRDYKMQIKDLTSKYGEANKTIDSLMVLKRNNQTQLETLNKQKSDIQASTTTSKSKKSQKELEDSLYETNKVIEELTAKNNDLQNQLNQTQQYQSGLVTKQKALEEQIKILTSENIALKKQNTEVQNQIAKIPTTPTNLKDKATPDNNVQEKPFIRVMDMNFGGIYEDADGNQLLTTTIGDVSEFRLEISVQTNTPIDNKNKDKDFLVRVTDSLTKKLIVFSKDQEINQQQLTDGQTIDCNLIGSATFDAKTKAAKVEIDLDKTKALKLSKKNYFKFEVFCDGAKIGEKTFTLYEGKGKSKLASKDSPGKENVVSF